MHSFFPPTQWGHVVAKTGLALTNALCSLRRMKQEYWSKIPKIESEAEHFSPAWEVKTSRVFMVLTCSLFTLFSSERHLASYEHEKYRPPPSQFLHFHSLSLKGFYPAWDWEIQISSLNFPLSWKACIQHEKSRFPPRPASCRPPLCRLLYRARRLLMIMRGRESSDLSIWKLYPLLAKSTPAGAHPPIFNWL